MNLYRRTPRRHSFVTLYWGFYIGFVALPFRGVGVGLRRRVLDSCPSWWSRGFHDFVIFLHILLIRVGWSKGTALNDAEIPVITWLQVLRSYL